MIVRSDLTEGQKAVQAAHAAINFCFEHPQRAGPWFNESNYLVLLEASINHIDECMEKLDKNLIDYTIFREPDLGNIITAVAIEPSSLTQKIVSKLPLLFKQEENESIQNS